MKPENVFVVMNSHMQTILSVHANYGHAKKMYDHLNDERGIVTGMRSPYGVYTLQAAVNLLLDDKQLEESYAHYAD